MAAWCKALAACRLQTRPVTAAGLDTLIVTGGGATQTIARLPELADFACAASAMLRRIAGIGTGTFVLAEAGLLDGRHAALDRGFSERFLRAYPAVRGSSGRIFVNDRGIWTASDSAAGMELCLGLIEEDFGPEVCRAIAPGLPAPSGKSQYVAPEDLSPAEAADHSRAEAALHQVQEGREPFEAIARAAGFKDAEEMRRGFLRFFGQPPQALRRAARLARKAKDRRKIAWPPAEKDRIDPAPRLGHPQSY